MVGDKKFSDGIDEAGRLGLLPVGLLWRVFLQKDVVYPGFQLAGNKVNYLEKEARMPQFRKPFQVETKKNTIGYGFHFRVGTF